MGELKHIYSGKVREIFEVNNETYLMVASDRISAFDVILDRPIDNKGRVLNAMTCFWLDELSDLAPSHLISADPADFPEEYKEIGPDVAGRAVLVRKAQMLPIECIVRGYVSGSAWKEYSTKGTIHFMPIEPGLIESDRLPSPLFTPSTKATEGHDENISFDQARELIGNEMADKARELCLAAYERGVKRALEAGIIIADTKFELGIIDGELAICDEVLTPDSSRFWSLDAWKPGTSPPSFDKQPVRDWLESTGWNKLPPPPALPDHVVEETSQRYRSAYEAISGKSLDSWYR